MYIVYGALLILVFSVVSVLGLLLVKRLVPPSFLEIIPEISGSIFGVVGTIYAVMLAFSMFVVWEEYDDANDIVSQEVNQLRDLSIIAHRLDKLDKLENWTLMEKLSVYGWYVVDHEWEFMKQGGHCSPPWRPLADVWDNLRPIITPITNEQITILYAEFVKQLSDMSDSRHLRLEASQYRVPSIIKISLFFGAILTIAFTYFFQVKSIWSHSFMAGGLAAFIGLMLFLIIDLSTPFVGSQSVESKQFKLWFVLQNKGDARKSAKKIFDDEMAEALRKAAGSGEAEKVECLIKAGADVNAKSKDGETALMLAAKNGHLEVVKTLINENADVNAKNDVGDTASMRAAGKDRAMIVDLLGSTGAKDNNPFGCFLNLKN